MTKLPPLGASAHFAALLALPVPALAAPAWFVLDTSQLGFVASQQGMPVDGRFESFEAMIEFTEDDLATSRIEVTIETASATMGHNERDQAIHSSALLAVETYPTARFESDQIRAVEGGYEALGQLTIRDVTQDVLLPFTLEIEDDPAASDLRAQAVGELEITRLSFGVGQGDFASTTTIGDTVLIKIQIDATRPR